MRESGEVWTRVSRFVLSAGGWAAAWRARVLPWERVRWWLVTAAILLGVLLADLWYATLTAVAAEASCTVAAECNLNPGTWPDAWNTAGGQYMTAGAQFRTTSAGYVTKLYFYKAVGMTVTGLSLWKDGNSTRLTGTQGDTDSGQWVGSTPGWYSWTLPTPILLSTYASGSSSYIVTVTYTGNWFIKNSASDFAAEDPLTYMGRRYSSSSGSSAPAYPNGGLDPAGGYTVPIDIAFVDENQLLTPTPTPTATGTPTQTATATMTPTVTLTPTATPTPLPAPPSGGWWYVPDVAAAVAGVGSAINALPQQMANAMSTAVVGDTSSLAGEMATAQATAMGPAATAVQDHIAVVLSAKNKWTAVASGVVEQDCAAWPGVNLVLPSLLGGYTVPVIPSYMGTWWCSYRNLAGIVIVLTGTTLTAARVLRIFGLKAAWGGGP